MVNTNKKKETTEGLFYCEFAGLKADTKPTGNYLSSGSLFLEVDTGDVYAYDAAGAQWDQIAALGGSGS